MSIKFLYTDIILLSSQKYLQLKVIYIFSKANITKINNNEIISYTIEVYINIKRPYNLVIYFYL